MDSEINDNDSTLSSRSKPQMAEGSKKKSCSTPNKEDIEIPDITLDASCISANFCKTNEQNGNNFTMFFDKRN